MMIRKTLFGLCASAAALMATPALAQRSAVTPGNYIDITDVKILPGHFEDYMDYLKRDFKKECDWSISKGYLVSCRILNNNYPREGEPTVFLLREYKEFPSVAEQQRRADEYAAMMKMDEHQLDAAAEKRGPIRTIASQYMLQEVILK